MGDTAITHSGDVQSHNWMTHSKQTFRPPAARTVATDLNIYIEPKLGKRTQRQLAEMLEVARQEPAAPTPKMDFTTTTASAHVEYDLKGMSIGSRVMKTQDGEHISPERRDATILTEVGVGVLPTPSPLPETLPKQAFTIYKHFVDEAKSTFPMSHSVDAKGGVPFAKNTNFSKPMYDPTKIVE